MLRTQLLALLAATASAAVLPTSIQEYVRQGPAASWPVQGSEQVWKEYGLQEAETASYKGSGRPFNITAWRMADATGAMAAFQWQRPDDATPVPTLPNAVRFPKGMLAAAGNYLVRFDGYRPAASELLILFNDLEGFINSPLPLLPSYLPGGRTPGTERYVTGERSLAQFVPELTPGQAGLELGAELQVSQLKGGRIVIIRYPNQLIARTKMTELQGVSGALTHRSGPLVALLLPAEASGEAQPTAADRLEAEAALRQIEFRADLTVNEANPLNFPKDAARMILNIFVLAGILLAICFGAGLVVGLIRVLHARKGGHGQVLQQLNLSDR